MEKDFFNDPKKAEWARSLLGRDGVVILWEWGHPGVDPRWFFVVVFHGFLGFPLWNVIGASTNPHVSQDWSKDVKLGPWVHGPWDNLTMISADVLFMAIPSIFTGHRGRKFMAKTDGFRPNRGPMWLRKGYKGLQDPDCKEWPEFWEAVKPFWCIDARWPAWQASSRLFSPSLSEYDGIHMSKWLGKLLFPILVLLIHDIWSFATNTTQLLHITTVDMLFNDEGLRLFLGHISNPPPNEIPENNE